MTEEGLSFSAPLVRIEGQLLPEPTVDVEFLEVREDVGGLKTLRISLLAQDTEQADGEPGPGGRVPPRDPRFLDGVSFDFGKRVSVVLGATGEARRVFDGKISAIEVDVEESTEPRVTVFAEDGLMELRLTRRAQSWERMSDADIAEAIAARHELDADVDFDGPTWESIQQWNMSDLAFLRERARLLQAEVWLTTDDQGRSTLHFKSRTTRSEISLALPRDNTLLKLVARADLAHQRTAVRVRGWDAERGEAIDAKAEGALIRDELANPSGVVTGPEVFERTYGKRSSWRVREVPDDQDQAEVIAEAELRRRARAFVQVSGVTSGSPKMCVGSRVTLEYVGAPFNGGDYYVTSVCHTYDRVRGLRTSFDAERATLNSGGAA